MPIGLSDQVEFVGGVVFGEALLADSTGRVTINGSGVYLATSAQYSCNMGVAQDTDGVKVKTTTGDANPFFANYNAADGTKSCFLCHSSCQTCVGCTTCDSCTSYGCASCHGSCNFCHGVCHDCQSGCNGGCTACNACASGCYTSCQRSCQSSCDSSCQSCAHQCASSAQS